MLINAYRRLTLLVSDNEFDLIIDIHFQKKNLYQSWGSFP